MYESQSTMWISLPLKNHRNRMKNYDLLNDVDSNNVHKKSNSNEGYSCTKGYIDEKISEILVASDQIKLQSDTSGHVVANFNFEHVKVLKCVRLYQTIKPSEVICVEVFSKAKALEKDVKVHMAAERVSCQTGDKRLFMSIAPSIVEVKFLFLGLAVDNGISEVVKDDFSNAARRLDESDASWRLEHKGSKAVDDGNVIIICMLSVREDKSQSSNLSASDKNDKEVQDDVVNQHGEGAVDCGLIVWFVHI